MPTSPGDRRDFPAEASDHGSFAELRAGADELRQRLRRFRAGLARFFVDKHEIIDLMLVSALAGEPLLLVGPPGTAKSDLAAKFAEALGAGPDDYFEYLLTRFTEPAEILGPVDIEALRAGRYTRREQGKLPAARLAFLDEIFKSNSAILNVLLTILHERKVDQDGRPRSPRLQFLLAAANDIPEEHDLAALLDRFVLKVESEPVQETRFADLIDLGARAEAGKALGRKPWAEGLATLDDLARARRYLTLCLDRDASADAGDGGDAGNGGDAGDDPGDARASRARYFPPEVFREFQRLVKTLAREDGVTISDRGLVKLYKLLRARAWLLRGGVVAREDLALLRHVGDSLPALRRLRERVPKLLDL